MIAVTNSKNLFLLARLTKCAALNVILINVANFYLLLPALGCPRGAAALVVHGLGDLVGLVVVIEFKFFP